MTLISKNILLAISAGFLFLSGSAADASAFCQSIFSSAGGTTNISIEGTGNESQKLTSKMLSDHPQFYKSIKPIIHEGREYLEIKFKDNIGDVMGGGFVGGMYGQNLPNVYYHSKIVPFLESYGIRAISETHLIVPTPKTLKSLHRKKVQDGLSHSFYEPVEVKGLISPQQYLTLLAQKKWPIDATGSQEYLHDLLVHWPAAAAAPKTVADLQTSTARVAVELMNDKKLMKNKRVNDAIRVLGEGAVESIDGLNSIFFLSYGFRNHKENLTSAIFGMLKRLSLHNQSEEQSSVSQSEALKLNSRSRNLLREQGLSKYFGPLWEIDRSTIRTELDSAFEQRFNEF